MTPEQFDRLPKYAQRHINKLERDVQYYKDIVTKELTEGQTDTFIRRYDLEGTHGYLYQPLPRGATIWFPEEGCERLGLTVEVERYGNRTDKGNVVVQAQNGWLHVLPMNNTSVVLKAVPYER